MKIVLSKDDVTTAITNHIETLGLVLDIKQATFTGISDVEVEFGDKKTKKKKIVDEPVSTVEAQEEPTGGNDTTQEEELVEVNTEQSEQSSESNNSYSIFG
ncbi:hypothetical protein AAX06_06275 [Moraxella bovoculi]|uniref:Uncharacterized protein n=1 Tax=Moraxella bovoculi TaxID=386891 RepID=A0AAC8PWQ6_9GAMM|nr:hypothetical protein [Moraxella bovoculi]AKG07827.1 hypothetical protein AAX06_06275 [Moraxella bovoculi]AKG11453.1 hypothetical protein AAX07_05005 [Moraxella bovoculi]